MDYTELENSEPNKLLLDTIKAMGDWLDRCERNELDKAGIDTNIADEWVLEMALQTQLRQLSVQGRVWTMDVTAVEACERQPPRPFSGDEARTRRRDFWCFVRQYQDEMEARWLARKGDDETIARHLRHAKSEESTKPIDESAAPASVPAPLGSTQQIEHIAKMPIALTPGGIGFAGISDIMRHFGIPEAKYDAVDGRLKRFRQRHAADGKAIIEHDSRAKNQPRYLYNLELIEPVVGDLAFAPDAAPDRSRTKDFPPTK